MRCRYAGDVGRRIVRRNKEDMDRNGHPRIDEARGDEPPVSLL